jgi:hypothetical protein
LEINDFIQSFLQEFNFKRVKNIELRITSYLTRLINARAEDDSTTYISNLSAGTLPEHEYLEARHWVEKHAPHAMTASMRIKEGLRIEHRPQAHKPIIGIQVPATGGSTIGGVGCLRTILPKPAQPENEAGSDFSAAEMLSDEDNAILPMCAGSDARNVMPAAVPRDEYNLTKGTNFWM